MVLKKSHMCGKGRGFCQRRLRIACLSIHIDLSTHSFFFFFFLITPIISSFFSKNYDPQLAVKIIPRSLLQKTEASSSDAPAPKDNKEKDENRETRTIREASIMLLLHHPYIVSLKEVMVLPHHYYMFLEYVNGGQLLDYIISHGKLKEKQARKFARQIVSALGKCFYLLCFVYPFFFFFVGERELDLLGLFVY